MKIGTGKMSNIATAVAKSAEESRRGIMSLNKRSQKSWADTF
jgi:hypothetical protein